MGWIYPDFLSLDLEGLLGVRCEDQKSLDSESCSYVGSGYFAVIIKGVLFVNHLYRLEEGTVVQIDETELIGISVIPYPAFYLYDLTPEFFGVPE